MMWKPITLRWRRQRIAAKFAAAFGLLLVLIMVVAAVGFAALAIVRNAQTTIETSTNIQRLILEMDSNREAARRLQRDFVLQYPKIGVVEAYQTYALPASEHIASVIRLSSELQQLLQEPDSRDFLRKHEDIVLNLYSTVSSRYAMTFSEAVDLAFKLDAPETGLQPQLVQKADDLVAILQTADDPRLLASYYEMRSLEKDYLITRERFYMQSVFNVVTRLRPSIQQSEALDGDQKTQALATLDGYVALADELMQVDNDLGSRLRDFDLQDESVDPVSALFITWASADVKTAHARIDQTYNVAMGLLVAAALVGLGLMGGIATVFNHSVTRKIVQLTDAVREMQARNKNGHIPVDSEDEIGELGGAFNDMIDRIHQAMMELEQSEARFRSIFDGVPIGLYRTSPDGRFLDVNPALVELLGYPDKESLLAHNTTEFYVTLADRQAWQAVVVQTDLVRAYPVRLRRYDGTYIWVENTSRVFRAGDRQVLYYEGALENITERKRSEEERQRYTERLQVLHEVDHALLSAESPEAIAQAALKHLRKLIPCQYTTVGVLDPETGERVLLAVEAQGEVRGPSRDRRSMDQGWLKALYEGRDFVVPDLRVVPDPSPALQALIDQGLFSVVSIPLMVQAELVGSLNLVAVGPDAFSTEHLEIAHEVSDQLAIVIHQARLFEAEQHRRRIAETLVRGTAVLNSTLELDQVLDLILQQLHEVIDYDSASIQQKDGESLKIIACRGFEEPGKVIGLIYAIDLKFPNRRVVVERVPVAFEDVRQEYPHFEEEAEDYSSGHIRGWLGIPLLSKDRVIGMVALDWRETRSFSAEDIELALAFAHQAAVAIENAHLYERIQRHADELEQRVEERTTALTAANQQLQQEIAERVQAEDSLRERTVELEAVNEKLQVLSHMKDTFVSNVSHELRTPITNLKLRHHLLAKQPEKVEVHLEVIQRETDRLSRIIEDLLYLSRMDQGRIAWNPVPTDINTLVAEYVSDRTELAASQQLSLSFSGSEDLPLVLGDKGLIGQALSILLTNAINYTPAGGWVKVSAQPYSHEDQPGVMISVSDNGPGIPLDEQPQLFERFFRGTAGRESGTPGTGLGLSIVQAIVKRHEGYIDVISDGVPGQGTAFRVWLPAFFSEPDESA